MLNAQEVKKIAESVKPQITGDSENNNDDAFNYIMEKLNHINTHTANTGLKHTVFCHKISNLNISNQQTFLTRIEKYLLKLNYSVETLEIRHIRWNGLCILIRIHF